MYNIESTVGFALFNDTGDVDLASTLRNHLDVDIVLAQHAEESARDTNHVLELFTHQAHDSHIRHDVNRTELSKVVDSALKILALDLVLVLTATTQQRRFRVQRHGYMNLRGRDEVD